MDNIPLQIRRADTCDAIWGFWLLHGPVFSFPSSLCRHCILLLIPRGNAAGQSESWECLEQWSRPLLGLSEKSAKITPQSRRRMMGSPPFAGLRPLSLKNQENVRCHETDVHAPEDDRDTSTCSLRRSIYKHPTVRVWVSLYETAPLSWSVDSWVSPPTPAETPSV